MARWHSAEIKKTLQLGLPLIASQLVYASSGFLSTAFIAKLGKDALAASVLVSSLSLTLIIFFISLLSSVAILVAHEFGANNSKMISKIMGQSYTLGLITILLIYLMLSAFPLLLQFSHQSEVVLTLAKQYLFALYWMIPGLVTLLIAEHFLAGLGMGNIVLKISLLIVPIEIPLIYGLVLGKLGLPACGVKGVGYGLGITYTLAAICVTLYLKHAKRFHTYAISSYFNRLDTKILMGFIKIGLPFGMISIIEFSTFAVGAFLMAHFGETPLAAHQIVLQFLGFFITFVLAMSQATSVRVGHALGRHDLNGIKSAAYTGMFANLIFILPVLILYLLFPTFLIRLDIDTHQITQQALTQQTVTLLGISGVLLFFDNFRIIGTGALRGIKDTKIPMLISAVSLWLFGVSSAFILAIGFNLAGPGVWWGLTVGIATGALLILWRLDFVLKHGDIGVLFGRVD